eukprot:scaffold1837_cov124-Skeletonema_menzelii.AAC.11
MSDNNGPSTLQNELLAFCRSNSLADVSLQEIIERHGLTPINHCVGNYEFFLRACDNARVTEGVIQSLLEYFPRAASATNDKGHSPLHFLCQNPNVTLSIIQLFINAAPNSVRSISNQGEMPLNRLCASDKVDEAVAIQILKMLLEKCPEAVQHADNRGLLPIHRAGGMRSPEFCRMLIEAYPGSERITNADRMLPLHRACAKNSLATVKYLYNLYPDAINHATYGHYPIHCAIGGIAIDPINALEIVRFLLDCDPRVLMQKYRGRMSSIHYACQCQYNDSNIEAGIQMIKLLYNAHPEAIEDYRIASDIQRYHQQVQTFVNSELGCARQAKSQQLMMTPDDNGQLPLHKALQNNVTLGSVKLLVKGNPHAVQSPDNYGALPLHIACQHHNSTIIMQYLLDLDMRTLRAVDIDNNSALHYACRGAKYETITMLLEKYDAVSVSKRNAQKKLPIDLLWGGNVEDRESIEYTESVFRLLKACPETVMRSNVDDMTQQAKFGVCKSQIGKKRKLGAV